MMVGFYACHQEDPDAPWRPIFRCPDLDSFYRLELKVPGQRVGPEPAVLARRVREPADVAERSCWYTRCGQLGLPRDTVLRRLVYVPVKWRPTPLLVTVRRYRCPGLRARLAPGHQLGGGTEGEAEQRGGAVGAEVGRRQPALGQPGPTHRSGVVAHRHRRRAGSRTAAADQRPHPS